jgi:hypothetical protein
MTDSRNSVAHFDRMQRVAACLEQRDIAIYEHSIDLLSFGSFVCHVGTRHRRWRFTWDGRDGALNVASATVSDSQDRPRWSDERVHNLGLRDSEAPYQFLEAFEFVVP